MAPLWSQLAKAGIYGLAGLKDVKWHKQFGWFGDIQSLRPAVAYQIFVLTGA